MRVARETGRQVRRGPQREFHDDLYVRVCGECLPHIGRKSGTGSELRPATGVGVLGEEPRPPRVAGKLVEHGERGLRLCEGVDVGSGQPALVHESYSALLDPRGQVDRLLAGEVRAAGEAVGDVRIRDRDQAPDQFEGQGLIDGEAAQYMVHRKTSCRTAVERPMDFRPGRRPPRPRSG